MNECRRYINDFADRSFRDLADQDYVLARIAFRMKFDQQFLWCSLQAIEKYLKAILLYNDSSSKGIRHDLIKALDLVKRIDDLEFSVPSEIETFIQYISEYGADRYFSHPTYIEDVGLQKLDETVWRIRRYCYYMRQPNNINLVEINIFEANKQRVSRMQRNESQRGLQILGGYLEKIIKWKGENDKGKRLAYDALVWNNSFFGEVTEDMIENSLGRISTQNPTHAFHPEIFSCLDKLVDFPRKIKDLYKNH